MILSQATQGIACLSLAADHQDCLIAFIISFIIIFGNKKHDMVYVGKKVITALSNTSLPAGDKNFEYQPSNLFLIL